MTILICLEFATYCMGLTTTSVPTMKDSVINEPAHEITVLNRIGNQQRLRQACASTQSCQSLRCLHPSSMEVDKESDIKNQTSSPSAWLRFRV